MMLSKQLQKDFLPYPQSQVRKTHVPKPKLPRFLQNSPQTFCVFFSRQQLVHLVPSFPTPAMTSLSALPLIDGRKQKISRWSLPAQML